MSEIVISFHDGTTQVFDADTVRAVQHITTATVWQFTEGQGFLVPHTATETLHEAVERVTTPPHYPTDQEMIEMAEEMEPKARKVRALETQPRAQPRSSCCGTLGRRMSRFGNYCAACQHHTDEDRAAMMMINTSFVKIVEGEE